MDGKNFVFFCVNFYMDGKHKARHSSLFEVQNYNF